jgi:DNA-binding NarL/FixJ family response regulator
LARKDPRDRPLTPRQHQVVKLMCLGKDDADIGIILGLAVTTVRNHVQYAMTKMDAWSRTLLVAKYLAPERVKEIALERFEPAKDEEDVIAKCNRTATHG